MSPEGAPLTAPLIALLVFLASACAPSPTQPTNLATAGQPNAQPKTLTVGVLREAYSMEGFVSGSSADFAGTAKDLVHNHLTVNDYQNTDQPQLAADLPSVESGTWQAHADGTMDVTWKLRPGVKWHDGQTLTSDDLLFSFTLHKDPELLYSNRPTVALMQSAAAPDPSTLVVHWSQISLVALSAYGLEPFRRDLLEELYRTDKDAFIRSSRFTSDFVGLGPYRIAAWELGSHIGMTRYDDYFLGRPPLDRVVIRFIKDGNTLVANILSEAVDLIVPPSVDIEAALEVKERWQGTANLVRIEAVPRIGLVDVQYRPEMVKASGLLDVTVRKALYQAIDRESIAEIVAAGLPVADSWYAPTDPNRPQLEQFIPRYLYDPTRARQLLGQAGWAPGPDQVLSRASTNERFTVDIWINSQGSEKAGSIIADNWKQVGVDATSAPIPLALAGDRENTSRFPGVLVYANGTTTNLGERYDSRDISSPTNRWAGRNWGGYANPRNDELIDELTLFVDPGQRLPLLAQQVRELMDDVALMPLYWEPRPVLALASVKADIHPNQAGWNAYTWDKA